jgi:hypothetical protein
MSNKIVSQDEAQPPIRGKRDPSPRHAERARRADHEADKSKSLSITVTLPSELIAELEARMRIVVAEALDAQTRPTRLLTDERVCLELLGCSTRTLRDVLLPAGLPCLRIGDMRRYDPDEVLAWLRARREAPDTTEVPNG